MASQASASDRSIPPASTPSRRSWMNAETLTAFLFIFPSLIGFIIFYAVPAVRGLWLSFTDWGGLGAAEFIGLENYIKLVQDPEFHNALRVTIYYVLLNIPLQTVLALVIATLMDRLTKSFIVRSIIIVPWLMPSVVVGLLWLWLLDPTLGIVNVTLKNMGFSVIPFLNTTQWAMPSIAMINIWQYVGYTALLIFAGLQSIPGQVYEAASIDGASESQMFWRITIPLLRPVLVFVLVTSIIGSFQIFDTIAITTKGGPVDATRVVNWMIVQQAFERFNMGYATAISLVLFLMLVAVSLIQMRIMRANESDY